MSLTPISAGVLGAHRQHARRVAALAGVALWLLCAGAQAQSAPGAVDAGAADATNGAATDAGAGAATDASVPAPPAPPLIPDAGEPSQADASAVAATCAEHVPEGKERPSMRQRIASRGLAGYAVTLVVTVDHGKAEKLFPSGFRLNRTSEEAAEFLKSGFAFPDPDGGAGPELTTEQNTAGASTSVSLHFVALPAKAGRQVLTLPPVPITIARANGDLITLCTRPETLTIDPPIANTPNPQPHPNPPPRPQREVWESAKIAAATALIALVVGALVASLLIWLKRRPKPAPPPPPPRPPWEVALEELHDLRQRQLIQQERYDEHFDEVCLILRRYLGGRYGIGEQLGDAGALESTTEEILRVLSRIMPPIPVMLETESFLREADLVKFAKATPDVEQCEAALSAIEQIVMRTVPKRTTNQGMEGAPESGATRSVDTLVSGAASARTAPTSRRAAQPTAAGPESSPRPAAAEPPLAADSRPADSRPADSQPADSQPADAQRTATAAAAESAEVVDSTSPDSVPPAPEPPDPDAGSGRQS